MSSSAGILGSTSMSSSRSPGLLRRLIMFSLFVAGIVLWLSILGEARTDFPFELMLGLAVTVVGLGDGVISAASRSAASAMRLRT